MSGRRGNHQNEGQRQRAERSLEQLEQRFARFRREQPRQSRIPDALRRDALAVIRLGVTRTQLRKVCGVSSDQVKHWQRNGGYAATQRAPNIKDARVFSVLQDHPSRESESRDRDEEQHLELRLGGWSISVRRGPHGVGG
jgi:hypothetical protein